MTSSLQSYAEIKELVPDGLEPIPAHWEMARLKRLLEERNCRSLDGGEQLLRVSQYTGVTQRRTASSTQEPDTRAESLIGYKRVKRNDLVVNIMLAWNGSMGVSNFPGIVSPAYCVYRFKSGAHPRFFHYLLRSIPYKARIKAESTGVVESRLRLYTDDLFRLAAHLPPYSEQTAIARFLDHMDHRIQKYIRAKEKLIALLGEYKQALIHQAVTGQIDVRTGEPYQQYRDSGVEWLGSVPKHWTVVRLRNLGEALIGLTYHPSEVVANGGVLVLRASNVQQGKIVEADNVYVRSSIPKQLYTRVGDILICSRSGSRNLIGKNATIDDGWDGVTFGAFMTVFRSPYNDFLHCVFNSTLFENQSGAFLTSTINQLTLGMLYDIRVPMPPRREQLDIVRYLLPLSGKISASIEQAKRQIRFSREFRTRLIADVVTGKLDACEAAAKLPDTNAVAWKDGVDTIQAESHSHGAKHSIAEEANA